MYRGGLDPSQKVYSPLEIESAAGYFNVASKKSRRSHAPMAVIVPSIVFSIIVGVADFAIMGDSRELWMSFGISLISLTFTLPVLAIFSSWLPFALINRKAIRSGYAFAGEYSVEQYSGCNVFVFKDMHLLKKCSPKSVNLAMYDATSSDVLLGCLDALYSKIGGPLAETFGSEDDTGSLGECQVRRIAKSGVEATVGTNYSVLVGNEQFMARYGINFPGITFKHKGDEIYSICLSINGRATARIIVKYMVNEMFEMFAKRLEEDGIYCAIETFDPMISSRLLTKLRGADKPPISVVHLGMDDYAATSRQEARPLGEDGAKLGLMAKRSRLNLAVAATSSKKMKDMRRKVNLLSFLAALLGVGISFLFTILGWMDGLNEFAIILYWFVLSAAFGVIVFTSLPQKDRFSIEAYRREESIENMADSILDASSDK
jgi:hypothetical protein